MNFNVKKIEFDFDDDYADTVCNSDLDTFFIAWLVTGEYSWAGTIALLEILTKTFLYYFHERGWNYILWGKYTNGSKKLKFLKRIIFYSSKKK